MRRRINGAMLEWRPLDAPESAWRTDAATCTGRVWVRYRDASGTLRFRRQVEILPATARIEMARIGASAGRRVSSVSLGCLLFGSPYQRWQVAISNRDSLTVALSSTVLPRQDYRSPSLAPISMARWSFSDVDIAIPSPRCGLRPCRAGVTPRERVALGRLAALQAVVHTPTGGGRFHLEGRVRTHTSVSSNRSCGNLCIPPATNRSNLHCTACRNGSPRC